MGRPITNFDRYRKVLNLKEEGKTFQEIADFLGISRQRAFQIYQRAHKRFASHASIVIHDNRQSKAA